MNKHCVLIDKEGRKMSFYEAQGYLDVKADAKELRVGDFVDGMRVSIDWDALMESC